MATVRTDLIDCQNLVLGDGVVIDENVVIRGPDGPAGRVIIGDQTYIGKNVQIICDDVEIGEYGKVHHDTNIHGYKPFRLGHNAWVGQFCVLDSVGGATIGDNCGIGAHSQLWSHIKYGDTLEGCRFNSAAPLTIGNDVWFVGHCIVSPITAHDKSMAFVGSVITRDMEPNHVYGGSPAVDLTDKVGPQFDMIDLDTKFARLTAYFEQFQLTHPEASQFLKVVKTSADMEETALTYFVAEDRTYTKRSTEAEVSFMRFLLPEKAKFTPRVEEHD